jgi:uncharacterized membrane protein
MNRRDIARYVAWRHVVSWILALTVLVAAFFIGTGQGPDWALLLVVGFAIFVVTPLLYLLAKRVTADRD